VITLCSVNDKKRHRGTCYCTTVGNMPAQYERLECLVPTRELVNGYKYQGKGEEWYTSGYRNLLKSKWADVKHWLDGLDGSDITLLCFCREGNFCHRRLLAQMIAKWRPELEIVVH